jgi:hypothetical protein
MVGLAWKWHLKLAQQGKDVTDFATRLAYFAGHYVRNGHRLAGQERSRDALSPRAQASKGFTVVPLPDASSLKGHVFDAALQDNTRSPVPDQVAFRLDFPAWLNALSGRDQRVVDDLLRGERTLDVARKHGLSQGRVSQLRRQFLVGWRHFLGEDPEGRPLD